MALLTKKLKAVTLIETLVSMLILATSFGVGVMIYVNILKSDDGFRRQQARMLLNETAIRALQEENVKDEVMQAGNVTIQQSVTPYSLPFSVGTMPSSLKLLTLSAYDPEGKLLAQTKQIITAE